MKLGNKRHWFFHSSRRWLGYMAVLSCASCNMTTPPTNAEIAKVVPLNDGWEFQQEGASIWLPAEVPGDAIKTNWIDHFSQWDAKSRNFWPKMKVFSFWPYVLASEFKG